MSYTEIPETMSYRSKQPKDAQAVIALQGSKNLGLRISHNSLQ